MKMNVRQVVISKLSVSLYPRLHIPDQTTQKKKTIISMNDKIVS